MIIREKCIDLESLNVPRKSTHRGVNLLKEECTILWPLQLPVLYSAVPRLTEKQIPFKAGGFHAVYPRKRMRHVYFLNKMFILISELQAVFLSWLFNDALGIETI
jgi:hypothetical protein